MARWVQGRAVQEMGHSLAVRYLAIRYLAARPMLPAPPAEGRPGILVKAPIEGSLLMQAPKCRGKRSRSVSCRPFPV
jgi:hypothetical protein